MAYYVSEAVHDEAGRLGWEGLSVPGDQNGSEVITRPISRLSEKWTVIFRPKNVAIGEIIGESAYQCSVNDKIGYDQSTRYGLYNAWKAMPTNNKNIMNITTPVNCDCSAMAAVCVINAGINVTPEMRTNIEEEVLMRTGAFQKIPYVQGVVLYKGDILWRQGHTGVVSIGINSKNIEPKFVGVVLKYSGVYKVPKKATKYHVLAHPFVGKDNLVDVCYEHGKFYFCRIGNVYGYILKERIAVPK